MALPTVYLDFDGVLHPGHAQPHERFSRCDLLAQAMGGFECDIVISSSWRFNYASAKLKTLLGDAIGRRIVGITGDPLTGPHSRWREIERHAMFNRIQKFRALDDSAFLFPPDCGALIECEGSRGIEGPQCDELRRWLQGLQR